MSLAALPSRVEVDAAASTATVSAGLRWGDVASELHAQGYALRTMGSLPHIGVAGSVATGPTVRRRQRQPRDGGAGAGAGDSDGELVRGSAGSRTATVSRQRRRVGALGIVTAVTLEVVPTYDVPQDVYVDLPWTEALERAGRGHGGRHSVSLFTDVAGRRRGPGLAQGRASHRAAPRCAARRTWRGARAATIARHPLPGLAARLATEQLGEHGPWHERLPHFRLEFTPSHGDELQSEYLVARSHAVGGARGAARAGDRSPPVLQVSEIRSWPRDDLWLSPAHQRHCLALHFTWVQDQPAVAVCSLVEAALAPFAPRPHWGKVFVTAPDVVAASYPRFDDMRALVADLDPKGVFRNDFVDTYLPLA